MRVLRIAGVLATVVVVSVPLIQSEPSKAEGASIRSLLTRLVNTGESDSASYSRKLFKHWIDADRDCQDTRAEVLLRESTTTTTGKCSVTTGRWLSQYDGQVIEIANKVDIDHMIPLKEAWESGASKWSVDLRTQFANDLEFKWSLIAVSASSNRSKGDRDPAQWLPKNGVCDYLQRWVAVKYRWGLSIDPAESSVLTRELSGACGDATVDVPVALTSLSPTTTTAPSTTTSTSTTTTSTTSTTLATASVSGTITPGAFCSPAGATGYSSSRVLYTCKTSSTDTRNRWRQ